MVVDRIDKFIRKNSLIEVGDNVLACVSGGVDSMVMLDVLLRLRGNEKIGVAHCNFGLRAVEADAETEMVIQFCKKVGVKCHVARFNTHAQAAKSESIQMAARRLRYDFFEQVASKEGYDKIAIAHNFDDKIETFFINLTRGAGVSGLKGMAIKSGAIVRPLLDICRDEIEKYAIDNGVVFLNDSSNSEDKYLRNRLRHSVIPVMREVSSFDSAMQNVFENLTDLNDFVEQCVEQKLENFDIKTATKYLLYRYLDRYGFDSDVVDQLYASYKGNSSGKRFYSSSHVALIYKDELIVERLESHFENMSFQTKIEIYDPLCDYRSTEDCAFFDADLVKRDLSLRFPKIGDWFIPYGMSGRKLLSDFFKDNGISVLDRSKRWLLVSGDEIIWVVGMRTDNRFLVSSLTKHVLYVTLTL